MQLCCTRGLQVGSMGGSGAARAADVGISDISVEHTEDPRFLAEAEMLETMTAELEARMRPRTMKIVRTSRSNCRGHACKPLSFGKDHIGQSC